MRAENGARGHHAHEPRHEKHPSRNASRPILDVAGDKTAYAPAAVWQVAAASFVVVARSGNSRIVMAVSCPFCHDHHAHTAKPDFVSGVRAAACGGGKYAVQIVRVLAVVA